MDKARILAERETPGGLMGVAWLEGAGVVASKLLQMGTPPPAHALQTVSGWSYSYTRAEETHPAGVAVRLRLVNPGVEPWALAGAALVESTGEAVELTPWQQAPIPAKGTGVVVVGIEGERAQLGCPCTLKLWESVGPRTVTLNDVTFPVSQKTAP